MEDSDFGPVSKAILAKREAKLRELISLDYDLGEQDRFGWTPLHLSVYWPAGMEILLAAGVQYTVGSACITPLEYAMKNLQDEATLLLLDTDVVKNPRYYNVLETVLQYYRKPSSRVVIATIEAMVRKSNRLRSLAIAHLSPHELDLLRIAYEEEPIQVLDAYAADTAEALKKVGVKIPEALEPSFGLSTVYHSLLWEMDSYDWPTELRAEFADRLWSAGFHDINIYDKDGLTPLHQACVYFELGMVNWLMSHGGDPTIVVRGHSLNAFHLLSQGIRERFYLKWNFVLDIRDLDTMLGPHRDVLARIADLCQDSCRDSCRCACSPRGCTPTIVLLRLVIQRWYGKVGLFLLWCRSADLGPDAIETCCLEFARVEAFERLGITHVCCDIDEGVRPPMPQDTIEEMQDEESELIDQLESWMALYEEERAKFEGSAVQFLDIWSDMLKDELDVPAPFEEYWRQKCENNKEKRMPDYFARPSRRRRGRKVM